METEGKRVAVAARSTGSLGLFLAALLLPGGFLVLAWLLYRKWLAQSEKRQPTTRLIPLVALIALLQGCATQLAFRPETEPQNPETPSAVGVLQFQRNSIVPADPEAFLAPDALQPGDILLSSMPGLAAVGIKMMTFAPISHAAVYVGDRQVVEAVRSGVRVRSIDEVLAEETVVLVLRYPDLDAEQARRIGNYALEKSGAGFNFAGVTLNIPLSITRRVCELPLVPSAVRDACIRSMGVIQQVAASENQMFCSQLVLQAYRHAGVPITDADSRLISPADILHMREGDVSSVRIRKLLRYVGHLKYERPITVAFQQ
jgi:hypothetical protein